MVKARQPAKIQYQAHVEPHSRLHQRAQIQRCRTDGADISECAEHTQKLEVPR